MSDPTPFADAAWPLIRAGWEVIPLPPGRKAPPEDGTTGATGEPLTRADVQTKIEDQPDANIGVRAPADVLGIDVDDYPKGDTVKTGAADLAEYERRLGPLPPTWKSTARDGPSGIRWFRVPSDAGWPGNLSDSIEIVHHGHRYGVAPPSTNPDANGAVYRWVAPDGTDTMEPPNVADLPALPAAWVEDMAQAAAVPGVATDLDEAKAWVGQFRSGEPCDEITETVDRFMRTNRNHDQARDAAQDLIWFGSLGHRGAAPALGAVKSAFYAYRTASPRTNRPEGEWHRIMKWAVGKARRKRDGEVRKACTCVVELHLDDLPPLDDVPPPDEAPPHDDRPAMPDPDADDDTPRALEFLTIGELAAKVDGAGPRTWLLSRLWPAGDYGVHSAEEKAQKSWNTVDLAVSVASGTPWLGHVPVETVGPVIMFVGEGGEANTVRRLRGIAAEKGIRVEDLPIHICTRAPHLSNNRHMLEFAHKVRQVQPVLVTLDPLYLAAKGGQLGDLLGMGEMLEGAQHLCQQAGASLWVVHHNNRTGRKGARAMSGAGPAEWGRVILTAEVKAKRTDPETLETDVTTKLSVIGGEIADQSLRIRRRIHTDDPDDLNAPYRIITEASPADTMTSSSDDPEDNLPPGALNLLKAARTDPDRDWTRSELVDTIVQELGEIPLKRETSSRYLNDLERLGLMKGDMPDRDGGQYQTKIWRLIDRVTPCDVEEDHTGKNADSTVEPCDVTRDGHTAGAPVDRVISPRRGDHSVTRQRPPDGHTEARCTSCSMNPQIPDQAHARYAGLCLACAEAATPDEAAS